MPSTLSVYVTLRASSILGGVGTGDRMLYISRGRKSTAISLVLIVEDRSLLFLLLTMSQLLKNYSFPFINCQA